MMEATKGGGAEEGEAQGGGQKPKCPTYRMPSVSLVYVTEVTDSLGGVEDGKSTTLDVCRSHSVFGDTGVSCSSPRKITDSFVRGARWPRLRANRVMNTPPAVGTCSSGKCTVWKGVSNTI